VSQVHELAPAKVNLSLCIVGRRDDGYHLLDSLVVFADVGDVVELEITFASDRAHESESVVVRGPFANQLHAALADGTRLSVEAAYEIARAAARPLRYEVDLILDKNLPVAAGLGGGTSDAAAVLRALVVAFGLEWDEAHTAREALILGADGPACVLKRPLIMRGIGEDLTPLTAWPDLPVVLVNSGAPVNTAEVFAAFDAYGSTFSEPPPPPPQTRDVSVALAYLETAPNDLTHAALTVEPSIADVISVLSHRKDARLVRLSGSGGTCWAVFDSLIAARSAAVEISQGHPSWWVEAAILGGAGLGRSGLSTSGARTDIMRASGEGGRA